MLTAAEQKTMFMTYGDSFNIMNNHVVKESKMSILQDKMKETRQK